MVVGQKHHLKRINAPKHWMLAKLGGIWAPRPSQGPHKLRECLPLCLILRNRLKYALTRRETKMICMRRLVRIDGYIRTDINYPAGFQDVITIAKSNKNFRIIFDAKGRYRLHDLAKSPGEDVYKLCKVRRTGYKSRACMGRNPFKKGKQASIPYLLTTDGRTIRYPDPEIKANDVIQYNFKEKEIVRFVKFGVGNIACVTRGKNIGRIGIISKVEKHPGSFDIVHITERERKGHETRSFCTRIGNVFMLGKGDKPWITLGFDKGIRPTIFEDQERCLKRSRQHQ